MKSKRHRFTFRIETELSKKLLESDNYSEIIRNALTEYYNKSGEKSET